jgi:hypothetical protein
MSWIRMTEDNDVYVYTHADGRIVINANRETGFSEDTATNVTGVVEVLDRLVKEGVRVDPDFHLRLAEEANLFKAHDAALKSGQYACRQCFFAAGAVRATEHRNTTGHVIDSPSHPVMLA